MEPLESNRESVHEVNTVLLLPKSVQGAEVVRSLKESLSLFSSPTGAPLSSKYTFIILLRSFSAPESVLATLSSGFLPNMGPV